MRILKINTDKKCFYNIDGIDKTILDISKEDIFYILRYIYENDDIEFDEYVEENIVNEAEKTIYSNLYNKFIDFKSKKEILKNEINEIFSELEEKYLSEN